MNRRSFLKRCAGAVLGAVAAVYAPVSALPRKPWTVIHNFDDGVSGASIADVATASIKDAARKVAMAQAEWFYG